MAPSGPAAGRGTLAPAAELCGLANHLKPYLDKAGPLKKLGGLELASICAQGGQAKELASTAHLVRCALNLLVSDKIVHCPLPPSWALPLVIECGLDATKEGGEKWDGVADFIRLFKLPAQVPDSFEHSHGRARAVIKDSALHSKVLEWVNSTNDRSTLQSEMRGRFLVGAGGRVLSPTKPSIALHRVKGRELETGDASVAGVLREKNVDTARAVPIRRSRRKRHAGCLPQLVSRVYEAVKDGVLACYTGSRAIAEAEVAEAVERATTRLLCGLLTEKHAPHYEKRWGSKTALSVGNGRHRLPWQGGGAPSGSLLGNGNLSSVVDLDPALEAEIAARVTVEAVVAALLGKDSALAVRSMLLERFPRKSDPQASLKTNIYLDSVLADLADIDAQACRLVCSLLTLVPPRAVYEDQVCAAIIQAFSVAQNLQAVAITAAIIAELASGAHRFQALTDCIKATASNCIFEWAVVCEMQCLLGRGVAPLNLTEDARRRVSEEPDMEVPVDLDRLRVAVDAVLAEELEGVTIKIDSLEHHWNRRFEWCVAGSHSFTSNSTGVFGGISRYGPFGARMTRRMAMEHVSENAVAAWGGEVQVSAVEKLELGKTRAIYSCNTVSYAAFSRVLRPAEKAWRGHRVIVDPGAGGNYGMFKRIRESWPKTHPVVVMLDYADFNSQHTLAAQQTVVAALLDRCPGVEADEKQTLIDSFDNMEVFVNGEKIGKVKRSLMSGHRGTSFINSVLNAAYIRLVVGNEQYNRIQSFHVGDDVLIFCTSIAEGYSIIDGMRKAGFHLQPKKQSIGTTGFEFLRMAGTREGAHGYLARSVGSLVSGNWTTDWRHDPTAMLHSYVQQCRSIMNRSKNPEAYKLVCRSAAAKTSLPLEVLGEVLSGWVAVGAGPVYRPDGRYVCREVLEMQHTQQDDVNPLWDELPRYATSDYFKDGRAEVEDVAMRLVGYKPWAAALRSTYGDLVVRPGCNASGRREHAPEEAKRLKTVSLGGKVMYHKTGALSLDSELNKKVSRGVLAQYPIIALLQKALTDEDLDTLLKHEGVYVPLHMARITAFGGTRVGAVVHGYLPYSDAAALGSRGLLETVRVVYPLCM